MDAPPKETRKVNQLLRLDRIVPKAFRQEGSSGQARISAVPCEHLPKHHWVKARG